jgi:phage recombination protein Bet
VTLSTELAIAEDQMFFDSKQLAALTHLGVGNASRADLAIFFHQCVRTGLDPFARQIYMIERQGKQTIQTGIDGFRLIARRASDRAHEKLGYGDTLWCGADGQWTDVWLSTDAPHAAKVTVFRDGEPFPGVALLSEYIATKRDGSPTQMWATKPALMLAKCAEALALRKAFPQDLSNIFTNDEISGEDIQEPASPVARSGAARLAAAVGVETHPVTVEPTDEDLAALNAEAAEAAADLDTPSTGLFATGDAS